MWTGLGSWTPHASPGKGRAAARRKEGNQEQLAHLPRPDWLFCLILFCFSGKGATAHLETGGFIRSQPGVPHPDIQFHFLPSQVIDHGRVPTQQEAYQVSSWRSLSFSGCFLPTRKEDAPIFQDSILPGAIWLQSGGHRGLSPAFQLPSVSVCVARAKGMTVPCRLGTEHQKWDRLGGAVLALGSPPPKALSHGL